MSDGDKKPLHSVSVTLELYCSKDNYRRFLERMVEKAVTPADIIAILNDCSEENNQIWISGMNYNEKQY